MSDHDDNLEPKADAGGHLSSCWPSEPAPHRTLETLRAKVERLAGAQLKARLVPLFGKPFVVDLGSQELALKVRHHWLDDVDVDVEVERNLGGEIVKGRLLRFHPLSDEPGVEAWRQWVTDNEPEYIPDEDSDD